MMSWCHGTPGIGMARSAMSDTSTTDKKLEEIKDAAIATNSFGLGGGDNLCCGNFGRIDALLSMGQSTGINTYIDQAITLAEQTSLQSEKLGGFALLPGIPRHVTCPGFFDGLSGIGYVYLRLFNPDKFPSVLTWS